MEKIWIFSFQMDDEMRSGTWDGWGGCVAVNSNSKSRTLPFGVIVFCFCFPFFLSFQLESIIGTTHNTHGCVLCEQRTVGDFILCWGAKKLLVSSERKRIVWEGNGEMDDAYKTSPSRYNALYSPASETCSWAMQSYNCHDALAVHLSLSTTTSFYRMDFFIQFSNVSYTYD